MRRMETLPEEQRHELIERLYAKWLCLPTNIILSPKDSNQFTDLERKILSIRTRKEFGKQFGVSTDSLQNWEKGAMVKAEKKKWKDMFRCLTPNVAGKLYENIIEEGDAASIKLWFQHIEGEQDEGSINFNFGAILENMKEDGDIPNANNRPENKDNPV